MSNDEPRLGPYTRWLNPDISPTGESSQTIGARYDGNEYSGGRARGCKIRQNQRAISVRNSRLPTPQTFKTNKLITKPAPRGVYYPKDPEDLQLPEPAQLRRGQRRQHLEVEALHN